MSKNALFGLFFLAATSNCGGRTAGTDDFGQSMTVGGSSSTMVIDETGGSSIPATASSIASNATGGQSSVATTTHPTTTVAGSTSVSATGGTSSTGGTSAVNTTSGLISVSAIGKSSVLDIDLQFGYETPETQIIVPPDGVYFSEGGFGFINFAITSKGSNPIRMSEARVCQTDPNATGADFNHVSVSWANTEVLSTDAPSVGNCWNLFPTNQDFIIYPGGSKLMWLNASVAQPVGSIASDNRTNVPLSGHTPILTMTSITFRSYATETTWDGYDIVLHQPSNRMVVRAASASILQAGIPKVALEDNKELVIHRNEINVVHTVGVKHLEVTLEKAGNYAVHSFKVYRSDPFFTQLTEIPSNQVQLNVWTDVPHGVMNAVPSDAIGAVLLIEFLNEETIAYPDSGHYVITAQTTGVVSGNTLTTSYWNSQQTDTTGSMGPTQYGQYTLHHTFDSLGGRMLWSDHSVSPHNDQQYGSADWINDGNVRSGSKDNGPVQLTAP
ncbi:MAG: hypothetical protein WC477_04675 [Patescibacteria group bacterium]